MGHSHGHAHGPSASGHDRPGARYRNRLAAAFVLIACFFVAELAASLATGSLALLADAGHMAADVVALGAALAAMRLADRPDTTGRRSFGSYRAEVFASGLSVVLMLTVAVYIVFEAVQRGVAGRPVATVPVLVLGLVGLAVNLVALALLRGGASESLNVKGAYLEVVADTVGSLGVVAAALLIRFTGWPTWDTLVALAIAAFVAVRALWLGREVYAVLAQHAPAGMDPDEVERDLAAIPSVDEVHDLHLWTLTSGMNVATAHLVTEDAADPHAVLDAARDVLRDRHRIAHATLQVEPRNHEGCHDIDW